MGYVVNSWLSLSPSLAQIFGEAVLGLSQGSVSELLSKPKPWHMLSIKGREPFIRMQLWLNDPGNVEKLQQIKNERREANKRRRQDAGPGSGSMVPSDSGDSNDYYSMTPSPSSTGGCSTGSSSTKKHRVLFTDEQKEALRVAFQMDPYPSMSAIDFLAQELSLTQRTITNWFHNHRMRMKQSVSPFHLFLSLFFGGRES
jgi:homeobox protein cut-like